MRLVAIVLACVLSFPALACDKEDVREVKPDKVEKERDE
jgi:hypothetical protein